MSAISFVESYKNYAIELLITTILWFLFVVFISLIAVGWTRGLMFVSTKLGNLFLAGGVLAMSVLFAFLHAERWFLAIARKILFGH